MLLVLGSSVSGTGSYHSSLTDREADARRRMRLEAAGYEVVEVWDNEIWHQRTLVAERVRKAIWRLRAAA